MKYAFGIQLLSELLERLLMDLVDHSAPQVGGELGENVEDGCPLFPTIIYM